MALRKSVSQSNEARKNLSWVPITLLALAIAAALIAAGGSFYTIDQGERGVVLRYGEIIDVAEPGLNFKIPMIDSVKEVSVRTVTGEMRSIFAYSRDQQPAELNLSITFSIPESGVKELYAKFANIETAYERVIQPIVKQELKTVFGQYTAYRSVQEREQLNTDVFEAITEGLSAYPFLTINSIQIENIDFSDAYEQTIEDRMKAEVEVERFKQNLERERIEAEIAVTRAQAKADAQVKAAEAEAKAIALRSEAEANAIAAKGKTLRDNPQIIALIQAEKWDGQLPRTMLPNGSMPMITIGDKANNSGQ